MEAKLAEAESAAAQAQAAQAQAEGKAAEASAEVEAARLLSEAKIPAGFLPYVKGSLEGLEERVQGLKRLLWSYRRMVADELTPGLGRRLQQTPMGGGTYTLQQLHSLSAEQVSRDWPGVQRSLRALGIEK